MTDPKVRPKWGHSMMNKLPSRTRKRRKRELSKQRRRQDKHTTGDQP